MKKTKLIVAVAILATGIFTACKGDEPNGGGDNNSPAKIGILINGVVWAPYNVGATGKFVAKPEDYGGLYQWNRKDTANFLLVADYFASDFSKATSWLPANDPSPAGWRVPTSAELDSLLDAAKVTYEWTTVNGINGSRFTDKATSKSIFLPAAGARDNNSGMSGYIGDACYYWNSTQFDDYNATFLFSGNGGAYLYNDAYKANGFSIRPVAK